MAHALPVNDNQRPTRGKRHVRKSFIDVIVPRDCPFLDGRQQ